MRRFSVLIGIAVVAIAIFVGYTFKRGLERRRNAKEVPTPKVRLGDDLSAAAWSWNKDDPQTNKPISRLVAQSIRATHDPSTFELTDMKLRLFDKNADTYTFVRGDKALYDERSGVLKSGGPVTILMHIPANDNAEDAAVAKKHVRVDTTGVTYETKTGKATTDQPAKFVFPDGGGHAVGADYDPNTKALHLHSKVSLDWVGQGPEANKLHVETSDLVYKEADGKVYMKPSAKLTRLHTTIEAANVVVQLEDGRLHQIDGDNAVGADIRDDRKTGYSANKMTALFNENGTLINMVGNGNAKVSSSQPETETTLTGNHADLRFATQMEAGATGEKEDSVLHLVLADGNAVAESKPVIRPQQASLNLPDTRLLRSEHIELEMQPDGKDVKEIRTPDKSQLEFKPNRPGFPRRVVDASRLRVLYGPNSYVDAFRAWNVQTRTDKVAVPSIDGPPAKPPSPALTWSDELVAKFQTQSNQVASIEQTGNFRYQEGLRKAAAGRATLNQISNEMTLQQGARMSDDMGSTVADKIDMNQATGDMSATGHVVSTREPDKNQKPGTSMLDSAEAMQAKADKMETRERNSQVHYQGHVVMWQGANRILCDSLDIDRDEKTLHATGNVVSELLDNKKHDEQTTTKDVKVVPVKAEPVTESAPIFTTVYAPDLVYNDETRVAHYTGGVKMIRQQMTVTAKELTAFLTPRQESSDDSSLDHALAEGNVTVFRTLGGNRTRTGTGERCEYFTKDDKVVLTGGSPKVVDSFKGVTEGNKLTYFNNEDYLLVDGGKKPVFTEMKKKNK